MLSKYIIAIAALGFSAVTSAQQPCGLKIAPCPFDMRCMPDSQDCTDLNRCRGTCQYKNKYKSCGGRRAHPVTCEAGFECKDDPRLPESCGLSCDIPGICMPKKPHNCGGFAGFSCPKSLYCYDIPKDDCDPKNGGADCMGLCL